MKKCISVLFIVLFIELLASYYSYTYFKDVDADNADTIMDHTVEDIVSDSLYTMDAIKHNLARNAAFLRINGLFATTAEEYSDYIQYDSIRDDEVLETYIWIEKITDNQFDEFEQYCSESIKENCTVNMIVNAEPVIFGPVVRKDEYYPVVYAEPLGEVWRDLIGFDMSSGPLARQLLSIALEDTSKVSISHRITLVENGGNPNSFGILMNYPSLIYINDTTDETYLGGIMMGAINVNDLFTNTINNLISDLERNNVDIIVFDTTDDMYVNDQGMGVLYLEPNGYDSVTDPSDIVMNERIKKLDITVVGRQWTVYFIFSKNYYGKFLTPVPDIVLASVIICLFFLDVVIISIHFANRGYIERQKRQIVTRMLGYVNHEIRNPLNSIFGLIKTTIFALTDLKTDKEEVVVRTAEIDIMLSELYTAERSCNILRHIVDDVLDIRKLEEGKLKLDYEEIDLVNYLTNINRTVRAKLQEKPHIDFIISVSEELQNYPVIRTDQVRLTQLLLNFLTNAIKFTDEGSVTLKCHKDGEFIVFKVVDTGRGIPKEVQKSIFEPFSQTHVKDSTRYGGVGLGLYLCKMLVNTLEGDIDFTSNPGTGSVFWFKIPHKAVENKKL